MTVNILGTNDAAVITAGGTANLTETNAAADISRRHADDHRRRQPATFVAQTDAAGSNGYGTFTIDTDGAWTYTADTAHNEFVAGTTYTDSFTVTSADGTTSTVTVNILGTNDAAVITPAVANLTETNAAADHRRHADDQRRRQRRHLRRRATWPAATATARSRSAAGAWTYTADTAHNEFVAGTTYTDSVTVTSADGTTSTVTVNILGTNDAAVLTPAVANLTETNAAADHRRHADDQRRGQRPRPLSAQSNVAGSNGYGTFAIGSLVPGPTRPTPRTTSSWPAPPTPTPSR